MTRLAGFVMVLVGMLVTGVVAAGCDIPGGLLEATLVGSGEKQHLHAIGTAAANKDSAEKATLEVAIYRVTEASDKKLASGHEVYMADNNSFFVKADTDIQLKKGEEVRIKVTLDHHETTAATVALYVDGKCWEPSAK